LPNTPFLDTQIPTWNNIPMKNKSNSMYLIAGSMVMIILAITITTILENRSKQTTDVRARASSTSNLELTGTTESIDLNTGTLTVSRVQFATGNPTDLGTWTVTPPVGFRITDARLGSSLVMKIKADTFLADTHTFTATEIKVQ
jgi:hypothetical protein